MNYIITIADILLTILQILIIANVVLTWLPRFNVYVPPYHPLVQFVYRVTEPILRPFRAYGRVGMLDLSPLMALFMIGLVKQIIHGRSIASIIALVIVLVIAFTVHEFAHAFVAYRLGDPTAKNQGRLSFDPRRHLDVIGTLMVLAVGFGWAKPVPVNPYYLRGNPKTSMAIVAVAGPLSNLALAILAALSVRLAGQEFFLSYSSFFIPSPRELILIFIQLNVLLLFFNLIPIPPLDGFKVLLGFLPSQTSASLIQWEPVGPLVLLLLLFFVPGLFTVLVWLPTNYVVNLLI
jgi:Zn-dependent protease